jgi:hypothetical protein
MKPKDIFGLAVRLLGLLFLYYGLTRVTPMLDYELIKHPDTDDIITGLMPVVFYLAIAWWLVGGGLVRWAYPESKSSQFKASEPERSREGPATPRPAQVSSPQLTGMEQAEQKLAALVEKPDDRRPS